MGKEKEKKRRGRMKRKRKKSVKVMKIRNGPFSRLKFLKDFYKKAD